MTAATARYIAAAPRAFEDRGSGECQDLGIRGERGRGQAGRAVEDEAGNGLLQLLQALALLSGFLGERL